MRRSVRHFDYSTNQSPSSEGEGGSGLNMCACALGENPTFLTGMRFPGVQCSVVCVDACGGVGQRAGMDKATWCPILRFFYRACKLDRNRHVVLCASFYSSSLCCRVFPLFCLLLWARLMQIVLFEVFAYKRRDISAQERRPNP